MQGLISVEVACMSLCVLLLIVEISTAYENYIHEARTGAVTLRGA